MNDYAEAVDTSRVLARTRRAQLKEAVAAHRSALAAHDDAASESSLSSVCDDDEERYEQEYDIALCENDEAAFLERTLEHTPTGDRYTDEALACTASIDDEYVRYVFSDQWWMLDSFAYAHLYVCSTDLNAYVRFWLNRLNGFG
jgi:hypothetical protein